MLEKSEHGYAIFLSNLRPISEKDPRGYQKPTVRPLSVIFLPV